MLLTCTFPDMAKPLDIPCSFTDLPEDDIFLKIESCKNLTFSQFFTKTSFLSSYRMIELKSFANVTLTLSDQAEQNLGNVKSFSHLHVIQYWLLNDKYVRQKCSVGNRASTTDYSD